MDSSKGGLRKMGDERRGLVVTGAFNAMSGRVVAENGFRAVYVTGAGVTNMYMGIPDLSFIGLHEICEHTARIRDAVEIPVIVDADTGFGNPVNTYRTVQMLERAGADAIQFEDQIFPKKCGGFSIVLYANAALQGAVAGMNKALGVLRERGRIDEDPAIVASFAERQRLVNKDFYDELERRYTVE